MDYYLHPSVNETAVSRLFQNMLADGLELHTLQVARGDETLVRVAAQPYSCTDVRENYSLSKLFTSTVVGIAVDRGFVREDDRIAEILGRDHVSEKQSRITLRNVISMNTGHDRCVVRDMLPAADSVDAFFRVEPVYEPGTHFTYNTGASCLLTSIVEKVTGQKFFDFACENLFYPLGITDIRWRFCDDGKCIGGSGLYASSDDIIKLGRMYANGGVFEGKRILSEEWIRRASSYVSDNSFYPTPDWSNGYGYQIWINSRDGYRGDGAFGQLCMILPKHNVVLAMQGLCGDMQKEIDHVFAFLDEMETAATVDPLPLYHKPTASKAVLDPFSRSYALDPNPFSFTSLKIDSCGDQLRLSFCDGRSIQTVTAGANVWVTNHVHMRHMQPSLSLHLKSEAASPLVLEAAWGRLDNKLVVEIRYRTSPHKERWEITMTECGVHIEFIEPWDSTLRTEDAKAITGRFI